MFQLFSHPGCLGDDLGAVGAVLSEQALDRGQPVFDAGKSPRIRLDAVHACSAAASYFFGANAKLLDLGSPTLALGLPFDDLGE